MSRQNPRKLLILDLDETLIYATELALEREPDFLLGQYHVYQRPGLAAFLEFAFAQFNVAVWTSSSRPYGRGIVSQIMPNTHLQFLWARERCTYRMSHELQCHYWVKDLKKVRRAYGVPLETIVVVDDSPEKLERQYSNLVRADPYFGSQSDDELHALVDFLKWLDGHDNIRPIEKRRWKARCRGEDSDCP